MGEDMSIIVVHK